LSPFKQNQYSNKQQKSGIINKFKSPVKIAQVNESESLDKEAQAISPMKCKSIT
jgi:hypothetical protein